MSGGLCDFLFERKLGDELLLQVSRICHQSGRHVLASCNSGSECGALRYLGEVASLVAVHIEPVTTILITSKSMASTVVCQ